MNVQDLMGAPAFTVWRGLKGKCEVPDVPRRAWDLFEQCCEPFSDAVMDELQELGIRLRSGSCDLLAPNRDDEATLELGLTDRFDDLDAAICALNDGYSLVKVPDYLGCPYFRLYVVEEEHDEDVPVDPAPG